MPIYEYKCAQTGHVLTHVHRLSDGERPPYIACTEHGCMAHYQIAAPGIGKVAGSANPVRAQSAWSDEERARRQAPPTLAEFTFLCDECHHRFDEIVDRSEGETPEKGKPCPKCGHPSKVTATLPRLSAIAKDYPRWSGTLGRTVESHSEYVRELDARGLRIEEDGEHEAWKARRDADTRKQEAVYNEYVDQLENDPAYANFRKSRDQGYYDPKPEELARMAANSPELTTPISLVTGA